MVSFSYLISEFNNVLFYFFSFISIISIIVFIHEYGHYIVAKACKVKIESFSIGFGPEIIGFNDKSGTRWKFSAIPIGGYVKMLGDASEITSVKDSKRVLTDDEKLHAFHNKPLYKKALIVFAGPLANIIFTALIFVVLFYKSGDYQTPPVIGHVSNNSIAAKSGLLPEDIITAINGQKVKYFEDIRRIIMLNPGIKLEMKYKRNNQEYKIAVTPEVLDSQDMFGNKIKVGFIGITPMDAQRFVKLSIFGAIDKSLTETKYLIKTTLSAIMQIVTGHRSTEEIGGPIKIAKYSGQSMKGGWFAVLSFMAMISVSLGVVNLLPIPMLDGGYLLQYVIEAVLHRNLSPKFQTYAAAVGTIFLLSLMAFSTFNDVKHIFIK